MWELKTEHLRLVPLALEHMRLLLDHPQEVERSLGLRETQRTIVGPVRQAIRAGIRWMEDDPDNWIWYTNWQIVMGSEARIIGSVGFKGCPNRRGEVEIGYGMDEVFRNRGYMTEAVQALVQWALAQPRVKAVVAETLPTNVPSMRVLQKAGLIPDRATDEYLYWRTPGDIGRQQEHQAEIRQPDEFELYDLAVVVERIEGTCTCNMQVGDRFYLQGGKVSLPQGSDFCLYALQAAIPLLPAKQRQNHPADWMETDSRVVCPDPACRLIMRVDRLERRILRHDDVSPIAWESMAGANWDGSPPRRDLSGNPGINAA